MEMEIVELRGWAYNDGGIVPLAVEYGLGRRSAVSRAEFCAMSEASTTNVQSLIDRMNAGDFSARNVLICHSAERLRRLTAKMFHDYSRLGRWEEVEDVMQMRRHSLTPGAP